MPLHPLRPLASPLQCLAASQLSSVHLSIHHLLSPPQCVQRRAQPAPWVHQAPRESPRPPAAPVGFTGSERQAPDAWKENLWGCCRPRALAPTGSSPRPSTGGGPPAGTTRAGVRCLGSAASSANLQRMCCQLPAHYAPWDPEPRLSLCGAQGGTYMLQPWGRGHACDRDYPENVPGAPGPWQGWELAQGHLDNHGTGG